MSAPDLAGTTCPCGGVPMASRGDATRRAQQINARDRTGRGVAPTRCPFGGWHVTANGRVARARRAAAHHKKGSRR